MDHLGSWPWALCLSVKILSYSIKTFNNLKRVKFSHKDCEIGNSWGNFKLINFCGGNSEIVVNEPS